MEEGGQQGGERKDDEAVAFGAVVQVGPVETWYRRAGKGRHLLLLSGRGPGERDELFRRLATEHLVIEPRALPDPRLWTEWLRGVVDGLGLDRPGLAVGPEWLEAARRFARDDPDRAGRVISVDAIDP